MHAETGHQRLQCNISYPDVRTPVAYRPGRTEVDETAKRQVTIAAAVASRRHRHPPATIRASSSLGFSQNRFLQEIHQVQHGDKSSLDTTGRRTTVIGGPFEDPDSQRVSPSTHGRSKSRYPALHLNPSSGFTLPKVTIHMSTWDFTCQRLGRGHY